MSRSDKLEGQALALAAVVQAVTAVQAFAQRGQCDPERYAPCIEGLLGDYQGSVAELYGGAERLAPGLRRLIQQLEQPEGLELTRYVAGVLHLERRLMRRKAVLGQVAEGLEAARRQAEYFSPCHENVLANLADTYQQTISTMGPRLVVHGEREHLEEPRVTAAIRALLLAGIRAATLWRLHGGGRIALLLGRRRLSEAARAALEATA